MDIPGRELFICLFFMFTDYPSQCATIGYRQPCESCLLVCCLCLQIIPPRCYNIQWTALGESCLFVCCLCLQIVYLFVVYVYRLPLTVCYNKLWTTLGESCLLVCCLCLQITSHSVLQ